MKNTTSCSNLLPISNSHINRSSAKHLFSFGKD